MPPLQTDPVVLLSVVAGLALWWRGHRVLRAPGDGTGVNREWSPEPWHAPAFIAAVLLMVAAASAPIDTMSDQLFWVHMVQHLILLMGVAPLLALGAPWLPLWYGLPSALRSSIGRRTRPSAAVATAKRGTGERRHPVLAILAFVFLVAGMWVWHLPVLYDLALRHPFLHDYGEHNTFLLAGLLFWMQVIPSAPFRPLLPPLGRIVLCIGAIVQNVALSVIVGFAPHALYAPYVALAHRPGGISALADQQFGAAIMWSVGDLPFLFGLLGVGGAWLRVQLSTPPEGEPVTPVAVEHMV